VLGMMDSSQVSPAVVSLCPADQVSLAAGVAAFLRPESAGATPTLSNCPAGTAVTGGVDLHRNSTARDEVVQFESNSSTILNLSRAATAVSLSGQCVAGSMAGRACSTNGDCPGSSCAAAWIAALVSEAGENAILNTPSDGDKNDTVV